MRWCSYRARWNGVEYDVAPDFDGEQLWMRLRRSAPGDGFEQVAPDCYVRPVLATECDQIMFVTTVCEWRREPCQVHDERDDELLLEYTGGRVPVAQQLGLERIERGVYRGWVPRDEVLGLRENTVLLDL